MNFEEEACWEMGDAALGGLKMYFDCQAAGRFVGKDIEYLSYDLVHIHGMCSYCRERCNAYENMDGLDL
jgi:hypothetical protein